MALEVTQVHRNLHQRVTWLYLEIEDMFSDTRTRRYWLNFIGRFLGREIYGIPLSFLLLWVVPISGDSMPVAVQVWKTAEGTFCDLLIWQIKPHIYCGLERDRELTRGVPQVMPTTMSEHKKALRKPAALRAAARSGLPGRRGCADGWQLRRGLRTRRTQFLLSRR